jgi:PAS domain S-box-containing protein
MVAVVILDKSLRCDFINGVAEVLTGFTLAQGRGVPVADLLWRGNPGGYETSRLGRVLAAGKGGEGEDALLDRDGIRHRFAFRVARLGDAADPGGTIIELVDPGEERTERALRESEQRLRLAVEATGIGIWDVNAVTGRRRWSPEFNAILGLPPDGKAEMAVFASLIHPADRDRVNDLYRRAYADASSGAYNAEFRIRRANDGALRWVLTTGRITFDADGRPLRGVGTLQDIHDRRQNITAVREREERLRIALVAGRLGAWRYDLRTGEQEWDETQYRLFGIDPSLKPTRDLFLSVVHPDDLPKIAFDPATVPREEYLDSEFRIFRPDGEMRWITAHSIARSDESGAAVEMIGVNRDVTEEKRAEASLRISEERNRLAIEANDVGTWDYDMVTGEHRWSDQYKKLWGLPADAPADPALLHPLVEDGDWEVVRTKWAEARDPAGSGRISLEYRIRRADDGAPRWAMFSGQIFFDEARKVPVRAIGIMLDTTDRREAEERQHLILKELNHRVKNNLAVVQAIVSQTIRMSKPSEAFERIQARLMAVSRTHDFLNRSNWGGVSLMDLLRGELEAFSARDARRVTLRGVSVMLDSTNALALGLVFHELATNAAKYGSLSADEGRLEVVWSIVKADGPSQLAITWTEQGGPPVRNPRRIGFGSRLIEGSVKGTLGGSIAIEYARSGLQCRILIPLPHAEAAGESYPSLAASRRW